MDSFTRIRKIIHIDMDAFYASVEQRDNAELRGKPVVVGGSPNSRSVVAAASYEARKFGIRSAISCSQAFRLCPQAIFVPPRFEAYKAVSSQIMAIFREYTDLVEPLSLDEAFLDVTENNFNNPSATRIAEEIRKKILEETFLTASAGVAPNKFLAKIASDMNKPNGIAVIPPEKVSEILKTLPVRKVPGIGKKTEERMFELGITTTGDLQKWERDVLVEIFGKSGEWYYRIAHGEDDREVHSSRERKSVGAEDTFSKDIVDLDSLRSEILVLSERVWKRLRGIFGRTVTLKVTYADFEKITRSQTPKKIPETIDEIVQIVLVLLNQTEAGSRPIRLLGVSVSNFDRPNSDGKPVQLILPFPEI
jgi:DNA polymerase-4